MAFDCKVQYLDDTDPFNSTSFPEPSRPPVFSFRDAVPICTQLPGIHRLLNAPHNVRNLTAGFLCSFLAYSLYFFLRCAYADWRQKFAKLCFCLMWKFLYIVSQGFWRKNALKRNMEITTNRCVPFVKILDRLYDQFQYFY